MCMRKFFIWRRARASYGAPSSIVPVVVSFALLGSVLTSPPVATYRTLRAIAGSACTIRAFGQPAMTSKMHGPSVEARPAAKVSKRAIPPCC
jgi:hypothetical protein